MKEQGSDIRGQKSEESESSEDILHGVAFSRYSYFWFVISDR